MNARSIHVRLIVWHTALIIILSVGFGTYTYYRLHHRLYKEMQETLERRAEHVRDDVLPQVLSGPPDTLRSEIKKIYSPEESGRFIRISGTDGDVIYVSGAPKDHTFNPANIPRAEDFTGPLSERIEQTGADQLLLVVSLKAHVDGKDYIIDMGAPTDAMEGALHKLIITLLIGLPVVIVIAVTGGFVLVRRALRPVEIIRAAAERITFSNLSQRLPVASTGDVIENLAITLNQMLGRLEHAYRQASRFSAYASHELRTPLTIMRSELESIESTMRTQQLQIELRERIGSVLEESERLSRIVEGLFTIVRLDAGEGKAEHAAFDLVILVQSTIEQMWLLADEKKLQVTVEGMSPVIIMGDATRLRQVIVNLFDNAIKYTPTGGLIAFAIHTKFRKAILKIEDNGIGISPQALPHVFEHFYRADEARSHVSQGAGLGLSIVRSICQAHGGTIEIESAEGAGTIVTVELPLADSPQESLHATT